jgi:hypothetical protein
MRIDLKGNVKAIGNVYLTVVRSPRGWSPVRRTVTIESESPWRRGSGWGLLVWPWPRLLLTIGLWREALIPEWAEPDEIEALGQIDEDVADTAEIKRWT